MLDSIKMSFKAALNVVPRWLSKREYEQQRFERFTERPVEYSFVFRKMSELYPKTILDVGTGQGAFPQLLRACGSLVTAVDNVRDYWGWSYRNRHYYVIHDDIRDTALTGEYDLVTCISVLEHIDRSDDAVANLLGLTKPGGHLLLTFPYRDAEFVPNAYELPGAGYGKDVDYVTKQYCREDLERWFDPARAEIVAQEYWRIFNGEYWTMGGHAIPPRQVAAGDLHHLTCLLVRRRP